MTAKRAVRRDAFFLDAGGRRLFAVATYPDEPVGSLLYFHPFGEELNKTRRMAALAAREFAEHGWFVLQPDLTGCGDSAGDFGDASWSVWLDDLAHAAQWLRERSPGPVALWALRAGSLLAADWLRRASEAPFLLLWQPVRDGQQHLTQVLRLKAANEMLTASENRGVVARLREQLKTEAVEVAGYSIAPSLASALDTAKLTLPDGYAGRVAILEVAGAEPAETSPATTALARKWTESGIEVTARAVLGSSFWQTLEIETATALIPASLEALDNAPL